MERRKLKETFEELGADGKKKVGKGEGGGTN